MEDLVTIKLITDIDKIGGKKFVSIGSFKECITWINVEPDLYSIAGMLPNDATLVEIGSWQVKSTYCLSKGFKSGKIFAIDPFNADGLTTIFYQ